MRSRPGIANLEDISGALCTNTSTNIDSALASAFSVNVMDYLTSQIGIPASQLTVSNGQVSVNGTLLNIPNLVTINGTLYTNSTTNIDNAALAIYSTNVLDYLSNKGVPTPPTPEEY